MSYKKCFNPCDECQYSYSKNGQQMSECGICEFNHYRKLDYEGKLIEQRYATIDGCFCTACNQDYTSVAEGEGGVLWEGDTPNYCPWCGAKFVSEEELLEMEGAE